MKKKRMALETRAPINRPKIFPPRHGFSSLSIKDLLDAQEAYHVYVSTLEVVVATAIGRYLIHRDDWYFKNPPGVKRPSNFSRVTEPVTLENSDCRPWSWPAVLIFVKKWHPNKHFGIGGVPRTLYLPDGRVVPTCVIYAPPDESSSPPTFSPSPSSELLGGGYLCLRRHQGEQATGTLGCLVRKGGTYYALTNRHVAGVDGEVLFAKIRGEYEPIAKTSSIGVDRQLLPSVFPAWPGPRSFLNLDAGLVRIEDINDWTSQVFGIGEIGDVFDATEQTITLDLIGCEVRAFGGISGVVEGVIRALFFRYESLGGSEYVTDVLIGPRNSGTDVRVPITRPGDSGTIWFYDPPRKSTPKDGEEEDNFSFQELTAEHGIRARRLRPIAMQWGGQRIVLPNGKVSAYALASFLSTICRSLDVQIVRNWSLGHDEYWGKIGHFAIGWKACDRLSGNLAHLMKQNQRRIGFGNETLGQGAEFRVGREGFVPLADVPDYVWIPQKGSRRGEGIQHFADIDIVDIDGNPSLLQRCVTGPKNISATIWKEYFDGFAEKEVGPEEGTLPFRVWQIWDAMVNYLKKKDVLRFVAAAGVLSHYVGDASQPLHCSYLHHGEPPMITVGKRKYPVPRGSEKYKEWKKSREAKIHAIYEEGMLEVDPLAALEGVDDYLSRRNHRQFNIGNGHEAAAATINLMNTAQTRLPPEYIIRRDDPELGPKERAKNLWKNSKIQDGTIACLADSVLLLAALWETAWKAGDGKQIPKAKLIQFEEDDLEEVYRNRNFLPGLTLDEMVKSKQFEP